MLLPIEIILKALKLIWLVMNSTLYTSLLRLEPSLCPLLISIKDIKIVWLFGPGIRFSVDCVPCCGSKTHELIDFGDITTASVLMKTRLGWNEMDYSWGFCSFKTIKLGEKALWEMERQNIKCKPIATS